MHMFHKLHVKVIQVKVFKKGFLKSAAFPKFLKKIPTFHDNLLKSGFLKSLSKFSRFTSLHPVSGTGNVVRGMGVTVGGIRAGIGSLRVRYMNKIMRSHDQSAQAKDRFLGCIGVREYKSCMHISKLTRVFLSLGA